MISTATPRQAREAQNRAAVLRNIGLEQGKTHGDCRMLGKAAELHYTRPGPGNCSAAPDAISGGHRACVGLSQNRRDKPLMHR